MTKLKSGSSPVTVSRGIDAGLLILRIGIGGMFIYHGWPKLQGGPAGWHKLGENMQYLGISIIPVFWGFMAMAAEFFGGILLVVGVGTRVVTAFLLFVMLVAAIGNLAMGYGIEGIVGIIEVSSALVAMLCAGSGSFAFKNLLLHNRIA